MPEDKLDDLTLETATSRVNAPDVNIEKLEEKISALSKLRYQAGSIDA